MSDTESGQPEITPEEIVRHDSREGMTWHRSPRSDHIRSRFSGREGVLGSGHRLTGARMIYRKRNKDPRYTGDYLTEEMVWNWSS
jgi:hypothetical protein